MFAALGTLAVSTAKTWEKVDLPRETGSDTWQENFSEQLNDGDVIRIESKRPTVVAGGDYGEPADADKKSPVARRGTTG